MRRTFSFFACVFSALDILLLATIWFFACSAALSAASAALAAASSFLERKSVGCVHV
jgi:hypothetical protein